MNFIEAIVLGIIQGSTEFLPISSTGHLTVAGKLMNLISDQNPQQWTSFIAVIQLGTLLAVFVYFWRDIISIIRDFLKDNWFNHVKFSQQTLHSKMGWYLVIATLPVVVIGLVFKDIIEGIFTKNLYVIAASLIVLAIILAIAEKFAKLNRKNDDLNWRDALIIGVAQAFALIPGSSRSGTTITAGLFLGFNRETAARFSFLMSIPAVAASGLLQFYQATKYIDKTGFVDLIIATIVSGVVGYLSIEFLLKYLKTKSMFVFIVYRIIVGVAIIVFLAAGILNK
ncbi:MAG: undecaprenyl-diphosphatase UppP [Stygiobacter sp. RIFOXYC12_FULL_38_8]|nr:MAG: undecaprenyl-diphosphatase UppP [Stygiobacter sp. GWC2_38_9]OGV08174.1 MAG: undecaprenyl-diphosphatase UppP [Stygiobacter sp. RIFOXYB2_FULL_37_11]OGV11282.1 MAG: undecaprenyl-diphosphatase UppP [Stygiobacter sp. RIFOXYA2_FULL_38_8]OGV15690.1 MAG: undecaprenyl-diphosphatase UppP [Stygiobacter sp. RIFOXYC2_FULL_38_25]OGV23209.1 MAG: undecaprenyl-diphosphatase UppP [Stygiobacter sp. RIFOXYC12_FULL_38_8]OGV80804.1 MAG: undecaprenyl-diphosphatase UppP [Stygiobacter sp. GWF2_38_21]RJQ64620.